MIVDLDTPSKTLREELARIANKSTKKVAKKEPEILTESSEAVQQRNFVIFVERFRSKLIETADKKVGSVYVHISGNISKLIFDVTKIEFDTWAEVFGHLDVMFSSASNLPEYTEWKLIWDDNLPLSEEIIEF